MSTPLLDSLLKEVTIEAEKTYGVPKEFEYLTAYNNQPGKGWTHEYRGHRIQIITYPGESGTVTQYNRDSRSESPTKTLEHPRQIAEDALGVLYLWDDAYGLGDQEGHNPDWSFDDHKSNMVLEHWPRMYLEAMNMAWRKNFCDYMYSSHKLIALPVVVARARATAKVMICHTGYNTCSENPFDSSKYKIVSRGYHCTSLSTGTGWFSPKPHPQEEFPFEYKIKTVSLSNAEIVKEIIGEFVFELAQYNAYLADEFYEVIVWAPGQARAVIQTPYLFPLRKQGVKTIYKQIDRRIKNSVCP